MIILSASEAKYKTIHVEEIKILTSKQVLQRFNTSNYSNKIAQIKTGSTSENLQNAICQIINNLY